MTEQQALDTTGTRVHNYSDAARELLGCWALAWVLSFFYEPMHQSLKWLAYSLANALVIPVLLPYIPLFLIALLVKRMTGKKDWWPAHRAAIIGAFIWVLVGSYGMWIGSQPQ